MANTLTLFCLVNGEPTSETFEVEVSAMHTVSYLKHRIKDKKPNHFAGVDATRLILWKVSIEWNPATVFKLDQLQANDKMKLNDPMSDISDVFGQEKTEKPAKMISIIVQVQSASKRTLEDADDRDAKRSRSYIKTEGPVAWRGCSLMLPFTERSLFENVRRGICARSSFVIHGPCQTGKTSFLAAMMAELEKIPNEAVVASFKMSDLHISSDIQDELAVMDLFARFWSYRVFHQSLSWNHLTAKLQKLPPSPRLYVLVDEFQSIFRDPILLKVAKKFFRNLSSKTAVSYVAVGTFKLRQLLDCDDLLEAPFNKAEFESMPPFDLREMGRLFDLYKEHCRPHGISQQIQDKIVQESRGHPASFMFLLKLALLHRPDERNWTCLLQRNIDPLLDWNETKLMTDLKLMNTEQKARVRDLTKNQLDGWEFIPDDFNRDLLNIGVLNIGVLDFCKQTVRFTSGIILRICINAVWPQPKNRLSKEETGDPINILTLGLQCISPSTVADPQVRNKFGPQENGFQIALFSALNGLLPTTMKCLFEAKAKDKDHIDLMLTENDRNLFGYELKVNMITKSDFKPHLKQAEKYAIFYGVPVYLVNFYLEGHSTPAQLLETPADVAVVNIMHNKDCTRFIITAPDGKEIIVKTNDSPSGESHP
ncbi:hypothetical protein BGZ65_003112 [Modicella reniformis]|uniref:Crinkler effector protein N-terminal domain-containing protein n=1 Tax=Modicella reniformis TaxID=1440133 RepID=A0A9P6SQ32_9FUNG|nr:hypothetical protein BGZ65_003112 [Modicella reniformis]